MSPKPPARPEGSSPDSRAMFALVKSAKRQHDATARTAITVRSSTSEDLLTEAARVETIYPESRARSGARILTIHDKKDFSRGRHRVHNGPRFRARRRTGCVDDSGRQLRAAGSSTEGAGRKSAL